MLSKIPISLKQRRRRVESESLICTWTFLASVDRVVQRHQPVVRHFPAAPTVITIQAEDKRILTLLHRRETVRK